MSAEELQQPRPILSQETIVLAECDFDPEGPPRIFGKCISMKERALLRLCKVSGSDDNLLRNGDIIQIDCGNGLILRGHSLSKYVSWGEGVRGAKSHFIIRGVEHESLRSQAPFKLESVHWPGFFLGKRDNPSCSRIPEVQPSVGTLVLDSEKKSTFSPLNLCAMPARISNRNVLPTFQFRQMFDRLQETFRPQPALLIRFRAMKVKRPNLVDMDKLDIVDITDVNISEAEDIECSVCLSEFEVGDNCCTLPCNDLHKYHSDCIKKWLQQKNTCPLCLHELNDAVASQDLCPSPSSTTASINSVDSP